MADYNYGIVVDSGSSGSRIQVYRWENVANSRQNGDPKVVSGPPLISQEDGWSKKISPGVSTFKDNHKRVWKSHYKELFKFAEKIVPSEKIPQTPVYILSTAGMRLIPETDRVSILSETCKSLKKNTKFLVSNCDDHVQTIDGSTEGTYGWLALNYLMGSFDVDQSNPDTLPKSVGFMDMGGASTQIAFAPLPAEVEKHDEDLATVTLRGIDGRSHIWRVFVETWLGFGANQGRKRYLDSLVALSAAARPGLRSKTVADPCMPKGSVLKGHQVGKKKYTIEGTGNYESCLREIYPLLMKHLPCASEPCLFNGIHAPKMDFEADAFVGVSEYWYTANDIFHSGGEYNFHTFGTKVKEYCESSWTQVAENAKNGQYSNLPESYLLDACFKAAWVINVLHEGFGLPRLALETENEPPSETDQLLEKIHVPFKSADSVDGKELSWTLGKILLVASDQIDHSDNLEVGVVPSALSQKLLADAGSDSDDESSPRGHFWVIQIILSATICYFLYRMAKTFFLKGARRRFGTSTSLKHALSGARGKLPKVFAPPLNKIINYMELQQNDEINLDLEEGNSVLQSAPGPGASVLRTRSTINFAEDLDGSKRPVDFLSKPFVNPKNALYSHRAESRDSLSKVSSSVSIARTPK